MTKDEFATYFTETLLKLDTSFVNDYSGSNKEDDFVLFCRILRKSLGKSEKYPFEFLNPYQYSQDATRNKIAFLDKLDSIDAHKRRNIACYTQQNLELSRYVASVRTLASKIPSLTFLRFKPCILTKPKPEDSLDKLLGFSNLLVIPRFPAGYKTATDLVDNANVLALNKHNFELLLHDRDIFAEFIEINSKIKEVSSLSVDKEETKVVLAKFLNYFGWTRLTYVNCDTVMMIPPTTIPNLTPFGLVAGFKIEKWSKDLAQQAKGAEVLAAHGLSFWVERVAKEREKIVETHARKAGVAAIMARNMSHNIGSHVIPNFNKELADYWSRKLAPEHPLLRHITAYNTYLQHRMDYIAYAITTAGLYGDGAELENVVKEFNSYHIIVGDLANKIVGGLAEGFGKVEVTVAPIPGRIKLALFPMGTLGRHAFYSILEGIIRNVAKHEYKRALGLETTLRVAIICSCDPDYPEYIKLQIYAPDSDRTCEEVAAGLGLHHGPSYVKAKDARCQKVIGDDGAINDGFWGIKEIKASTLFLRQEPLSRIDDDLSPPALSWEPVQVKKGSVKKKLAYVIYLKKFKYAAIVVKGGGRRKIGTYLDIVPEKSVSDLKSMYKMLVFEKNISRGIQKEIQVHDRILEAKSRIAIPNNLEEEKKMVFKLYDEWLAATNKKKSADVKISRNSCELRDKHEISGPLSQIFVAETVKADVHFTSHYAKYWERFKNTPRRCLQDVSVRSSCLRTFLGSCDKFQAGMFLREVREALDIKPILVCDERIHADYKPPSPWADYYQKRHNIYIADIADRSGRGGTVTFSDLEGEDILEVQFTKIGGIKWRKLRTINFSFLCLHLGRIQKIAELIGVSEQDVIESLEQLSVWGRVVIHSGRGKNISNLPKCCAYMDFSSLSSWLKEGKTFLVQGLRSLPCEVLT